MASKNSQSPIIVGILNITPDSFSDGDQFLENNNALAHFHQLLKDGANIIDIGGESTGPGSKPVSTANEIARLSTIVSEASKHITVSVDTYKAQTARHCLDHGASIINDISALRADPNMCSVLRDYDAQVILMYSKEPDTSPHVSATPRTYTNVVAEIKTFLKTRIDYALSNGIKESNIVIDPGMGRFISNDPQDSWMLLAGLEQITELGIPIMVGTSRKSFLGGLVCEREHASALTALHATLKGATYIRTHNPNLTIQTISIWQMLHCS